MRVIAVFKTHFDYGYTDLAENIRRKFRTDIISKVVKVCRATRVNGLDKAYKWTLPAWLLKDIYEGADDETKYELGRLIRNGQITCHALPFTVHSELLCKRQLDDLFTAARWYSKQFYKPLPISAKMTDVPGHTSAIIKPMVDAGIKFLHLGKNPYSTPPKVPLLFWWEDNDGNRILTMYNRFYGSNVRPPKGWKYPVWMALRQTGDNEGGHDVSVIEEIRSQIPQKWEFTTGTMDDFANELLKCDLSDLPVVRGELGDTWIHGAGTYPDVAGRYRRARKHFYELIDNADKSDERTQELADEFKDIALQVTEHTFGINVCKFIGYEREYEKTAFEKERQTRPEYAFAEKSWDEQRERVYKLERLLSEIEKRVKLPEKTEDLPTSENYKARIIDGVPAIVLPSGKTAQLKYEYLIAGADKLNLFMKKYLVRFSDWSTVDFGKLRYPEITDENFTAKPCEISVGDNTLKAVYKANKRSYKEYGNAEKYEMEITTYSRYAKITLRLEAKHATPFVEAGNFVVNVPEAKGDFVVDKCGTEVNVERDIVDDANRILWAMDEYARIGNVRLSSPDAPLVSFGKNAIMEFNGGKKRKYKPSFVVNLFNNQWGTNFPQWTEGNFVFEFFLSENE